MYARVIDLFKSTTVRQSAVTSVSTIVTASLGAVYYLLMARMLGPEKYGLFSLSLQIMLAITPLADFGTGSAIVRFVGEHPTTAQKFTGTAFRIKLVGGLASVIILFFFSDLISTNFLRQPEISSLLPLSGLGILVFVLFNFSTSLLQGLQKFFVWGGIQIGANIVRLVLLGCVYFAGLISPLAAIVVFILSFVVGIIFSLHWLNTSYMLTSPDRQTLKEFWNYTKWTALFSVVTNIVTRVDSFFTARYLEIAQTGIYSLSVTMSSFLPQFASSIGAVTAPKFSSFKTSVDTQNYLKKALPFTVIISLAVALGMVPVAIFVINFAGSGFSSAFVPFLISLLAMIIYAISFPIRDCLMYAYKQPKLFFYAAVLQGIVIIVSARLLIPMFGIVGAALSSLISQLTLGLIFMFSYFKIRPKL